LRKDPMFQVLVGKAPGEDVALAGKSTLNQGFSFKHVITRKGEGS
jgi:hypothetical protein